MAINPVSGTGTKKLNCFLDTLAKTITPMFNGCCKLTTETLSMCYVLIEHDNWIADTGYDCSDSKGEKLKVELEETIGKKIDEIVADIHQHPNLIKAVNRCKE